MGELVPSMRVKVGICSGVGLRGWLRCFVHPLGILCAGGMHTIFALKPLLLLLALQKWHLRFFGLFVSFVRNLP